MEIDVLGLGKSVDKFIPNSFNITIGVNDIGKHFHTDFIVIIDRIKAFTKDRIRTIESHINGLVLTHLEEWGKIKDTQLIKLSNVRGSLEDLDSEDCIPYSNNSTFVAVCCAYKMGATKINLYGVDFNDHKVIKDGMKETTLEHFKQLFDILYRKGVKVTCTESSALYELIKKP